MRYVGLDVHKRVVEAAVVEAGGKVSLRSRFECTRAALETFVAQELRSTDRLALEATTNTWAVAELLEPHVAEVVISNPLRTRAIAEAKIKTDKVDAEVLAQLLRCDYLPRVWMPDEATRELRHLTSRRSALVGDRTRVKNRIHAVLHQRLIKPPVQSLFSKAGMAWLASLELDELARAAVDSELRLLEVIESEIATLDRKLDELAYREEQARLLMTLPGVNVGVALTVVATLGDVSRFRDADAAASYLGLVPSVRQSAHYCYRGRITKQGRSHARWMMVQAAQHVARHPGPLGVFFRRLAKKKNHNVAVVATARKLVTIAYHMLKNGEPYRYATPQATEQKLSRLRVAATGKKRRGGTPKGAPRPKSYGSGKRSRTIPAIDRTYEREGLPPIAEAADADGEKRMLRKAGVTRFARSVRRDQRVPRKSKKS